jgi:pentatricopeptide repeat protein
VAKNQNKTNIRPFNSIFASQGNFEEARQVMHEIQTFGVAPNHNTFKNLELGYNRNPKFIELFPFYEQLRSLTNLS